MENEIETGEYVRTEEGYIGKFIGYVPYTLNYLKIDLGRGIINYIYTRDVFQLKHSHNLIDLIEYGDLVKFKGWGSVKGIDVTDMRTNEKINLVFPDAEFCDGWTDNCMIYDLDYLVEKDQSNKIDWILTHEQIENSYYKVKE